MLLARHPRSASTVISRSLAFLLVVAASFTGLALVSAPARAAASLSCLNTLYLTDNTSGDVKEVDPATGTVGPSAYDATPSGAAGNPNQFGIGPGGGTAINTHAGTIVEYDASSGTTTSVPKPTVPNVNSVAGAIDPKTQRYYYGGYDSTDSTLRLWVYDPATNTATGPVARIAAPSLPGTNGDLAFDADGTLYFVASRGESTVGAADAVTALYRLDATLPTSGSQQDFSAVEIARTSGLDGASNGIAFASNGYLYLGRSNALSQVNPITGATVNTIALTGVASSDLASCAGPSTLSVTADVSGRKAPGDQFTVTASGGDYDGTPAFPTGTTTGTDTGPQDQPGEVAGKAIVLPGDTYTATLGAAGTTNLNEYLVGYRCVDTGTGNVSSSGTGTSMPITVPTGTTGATTACSFVITVPDPKITLATSVAPTSYDHVGQTLTYNYDVGNTGNVPLGSFALTHSLSGLSTPVCSPVAEGATLAVGATTSCTATYTVTSADFSSGADLTDNASATGNPPPNKGTAPTTSNSATSTYAGSAPHANNDSGGTAFGNPVTLPGSTDDTAGSSPIVDAETVLTGPGTTNNGKTLVVANVGTWSVNPSGTVTFTPSAGYFGDTPAVTYRITDQNGLSDTATLAVTVRPGPTAAPDSATTKQNVDVDVDVLANDVAGLRAGGAPGTFDATTLQLVRTSGLPADATLSPDGRVLTVPGEGVHTVDPATGKVTFNPETSFTGTASRVTYTVQDQASNPAGSSYVVTVTAVVPTANDDADKTPSGTAVIVDVLANDTPGDVSAPLVPSSVVFTDPQATLGGKRLVVAGEGEWVVNLDGTVTFTPEPGLDGATTPVQYRVLDQNGESATATVFVGVGKHPVAAPDASSTPQNVTVTVHPLTNDIPGDNGTQCTAPNTPARCDTGTFDASSVVFPALGQPAGAMPTNGGKQLLVSGEGAYTIDAVTGAITFDPEPGFAGAASPVTYSVDDSYGNVASAAVTVTVRAIRPSATDNTAQTASATPVTLAAATDDSPGTDDNGTPSDTSDNVTPALVPGNTVFSTTGQPAGSVRSSDNKMIMVLGEGTWEVQPDGSVIFTPVRGFASTTTPVTYQIEDENGTVDTATLTVTVQAGPHSADDTATTPQNVAKVLDVLGNDTPGDNSDGSAGVFGATTVLFPLTGQPAGTVPTDGGKRLVVLSEGTYTVDDVTGEVTFNPVSSFSGTATPVTYQVTDSLGNDSTATITMTVTAITPTANDDSARTPHDTPAVVDVLANDQAGAGAALVSSTLRLLDPLSGMPVTRVVVPGEGTWTVVNGKLRFAPVADFAGSGTPMRYVVEDVNGTRAEATVTMVVEAPGATSPTAASTTDGEPVTVDVLGNVTPAGGETLLPDTVCVRPASVVVNATPRGAGKAADTCVEEYTLKGVGTWVANTDGTVTFAPVAGFHGTAAIDFQVKDTAGSTYSDTLAIDVASPAAQAAGSAPASGSTPVEVTGSSVLAATGGPALAWLVGGVLSLLAGLVLVRRFRRA